MPQKVSILFQQANASTADQTLQVAAGWSESMWSNAGTPTEALDALQAGGARSILVLRRGVLSWFGTVQAIRAQEFSIDGPYLVPSGRSTVRDVGQPGLVRTQRDHPHVSLMLSLGFVAGQGGRVRYRLGGVPDAQVTGGEAAFSDTYRAALGRYLGALGAWGSVCRTRFGLPRFKIRAIDGASVLTGKAPLAGFAVGDWIRVNRTKLASGLVKGKLARVLVDAQPASITLQFWNLGASSGGTVQKYERAFVLFDPAKCKFVKVVRRGVGLPFARSRGRRSRRS